MSNKILAAGSVALIGAGSLLGTSQAQAFSASDCGEFDGFDVELLTGDVCSATSNVADEFISFTAPEGTTALEAIIVGGGGGAEGYGYGYGGGGGGVEFINELDLTAEYTGYVGPGGVQSSNGFTTSLESDSDSWDVLGGEGADWNSGKSGNDNDWALNADGYSLYGGGAATDATSTSPGGGFQSSDAALVGTDNPLWPELDVPELGRGGHPFSLPDGEGPGWGGSAALVDSSWVFETGQPGTIIFRYQVDTLAATGVDANGIGMTAGVLGLSGVALGVVAAVRRSRRAK